MWKLQSMDGATSASSALPSSSIVDVGVVDALVDSESDDDVPTVDVAAVGGVDAALATQTSPTALLGQGTEAAVPPPMTVKQVSAWRLWRYADQLTKHATVQSSHWITSLGI